MSALPLISELANKGIRVRPNGSNVVVSPKKALTPELRERIKREKPALILSLERARKDLGSEWDEIANDPQRLKTYYELLMIEDMRSKGIAPDHYTATTECIRCGPVPIFEGLPEKVQGCPWCLNRHRGLPIPRAKDND